MDAMAFGDSQPLVPPLVQSSTFVVPDLDAIDRIYDGDQAGYIYARDGHPNAKLLAQEVAKLEGANWALCFGSGMSALSAAVLAVVQQGDHVLAGNRLYGRTTQLLRQELIRFGVKTVVADLCDLKSTQSALEQERPKLAIVETISNPMLRVADVPALAELCKATATRLLVDNTFATPVLFRPLESGADLVLESLTKMMGGHSDVTLGCLCGNDDLEMQIAQVSSIWGLMSNPFECWLAQRGLATLHIRMNTASKNAAMLANWLMEQPAVREVIYPGLTDHPEHELCSRLFNGGFGNMICFELEGGREAVNQFMRTVPFSPSLGHHFTTCSHPASTSHRYTSPAERARLGITDGMVRLSVGIEPVEETKANLLEGLSH